MDEVFSMTFDWLCTAKMYFATQWMKFVHSFTVAEGRISSKKTLILLNTFS